MTFSPIILGTMRWGIWGANHSKEKVQKLIETSLSEGLYAFDHVISTGTTPPKNFLVTLFQK